MLFMFKTFYFFYIYTTYLMKIYLHTEDIKDRSQFAIALVTIAYTDSIESARELLGAYREARVPEGLKKYLAAAEGAQHTTWAELFKEQEGMVPFDNGERWQCVSILTDPDGTRAEVS